MSVADLTGTTWLFNSTIVQSPLPSIELAAPINFTSAGVAFKRLSGAFLKVIGLTYTTTDNTATSVYNNAWASEAYRTISVTGGSYATDATLIAWIENNATQVIQSHDVTISYNNSTIAYLDASGTEVLETDGTICSDDITIEYVKPTTPTPSLQAKTNIAPTTSSQTITPDVGYDGLSSVQINAMPQGSVTIPYTTLSNNPSISTSNGNITAYGTATKSVTPSVTAGYVSSVVPGTVHAEGSTTVAATSLDANLSAENIKKDVSIFGVTGTYEGGGAGTPTLSTPVPQYMTYVALVTYGQYRDSVPGYYVPPVGETVYFDTRGRWELSSLYEEATGTPVPFTTISTSSNGSKYSFVMPNAAVAFDLYYND